MAKVFDARFIQQLDQPEAARLLACIGPRHLPGTTAFDAAPDVRSAKGKIRKEMHSVREVDR
jgi:hypothetical protein